MCGLKARLKGTDIAVVEVRVSFFSSPNSLPSAAAILTAALACAVRPTAAVFWCIFAVCYGCFR